MKHTQIKICGLTDPSETAVVNKNHVDLIGNVLFFEKSRRNIDISRARLIHAGLSEGIQKVAVVVSPSVDQLQMIEEAGFDLVQIHGSLPDWDLLENKTSIPILLAFNGADCEKCREYDMAERIAGFLFDAPAPGSGQAFDWSRLSEFFIKTADGEGGLNKPCFLAGGLRAENVGEAIGLLHPAGVDVSSGVEYADRQGKDPAAVERFIQAVRRADRDH